MSKVAVLGAGGKIGHRIARKLKDAGQDLRSVEVSAAGIERLRGLGIDVVAEAAALADAEAVVLAVPDSVVGPVAAGIEAKLKTGTVVIILDAAAPYAEVVPNNRGDIAYVISHPCHPRIFGYHDDPAMRRDHFGGVAPQGIVSALLRGTDADFTLGESLAKIFFGPVTNSHRITVDQMAMLEPGLVEMITLTLIDTIHTAMEETVRRGVPAAAVEDFLLGHLNVELAMFFGFAPKAPSAAALQLVEWTRPKLLRDDWKTLLDEATLKQAVQMITAEAKR